MFKMITWPQFFGTMAVLLFLYYLYVGLVYYRQELLALVSQKRVGRVGTPAGPPAGVLGKGPLISQSLVQRLTPPAEATEAEATEAEAEAEPEPTTTEEDSPEVEAEAQPETSEKKAVEEAEAEKELIDIKIKRIDTNDKSIRFTKVEQPEFSASGLEETEQDYTIGITQLNDHFERAAAGQLTKEQLVQQVPALENTELMEAFFKTSKQKSQQLTAALFAEMPD